jgi:predicted nuclease of predicted toxin-antitoxin system
MKILCDVHISYKVIAFLKRKGIQSVHVNNVLDKWYTKDIDICRYADQKIKKIPRKKVIEITNPCEGNIKEYC